MFFKNFEKQDYESLCNFFIELNKDDRSHINWNWARFEWMFEHPEFDKESMNSFGLWIDDDRVVAAAVYDMYFGEAFCGALPEYMNIYPEVLEYAYNNLKDDSGLGIAVCDDNTDEIEMIKYAGFTIADQTETVMSIELDKVFDSKLPTGLRFYELNPEKEPYDFQWLLWQGFDHGTDRAVFEAEDEIIPQVREHLNPYLSVAAVNEDGEKASYCCLWYSEKTDYAYVEPVCTIPSYRGKGVSKAVIFEALNRAKSLGAKKAYVLSDMDFYAKLGFIKESRFTFYWKQDD